jgi:hypothetical protein
MTIPPVLMSPPVLLGGASALLLVGYLIWQSRQKSTTYAPTPPAGSNLIDGGLAPPELGAPCPGPTPYHCFGGGPYNDHCMNQCPPGYKGAGAACVWYGTQASGVELVGALANAAALQAMGV